MTLLFSLLFSLMPATLPDSLVGTWERVLVTVDEGTGTEETQTVWRTFDVNHGLKESVLYEQRVRWTDDETVVLRFRSTISGQWVTNGWDVLLRYVPRTLLVNYEGVRFPDHDDAVQKELQKAFERKNGTYLRNYVRTMKNVLRNYFRRNSGSAFVDVNMQSRQFTATLGNEIVAFQRVEP